MQAPSTAHTSAAGVGRQVGGVGGGGGLIADHMIYICRLCMYCDIFVRGVAIHTYKYACRMYNIHT